MPGRTELRPLRVSERSNALQFSPQKPFLIDYNSSKSRSFYLYTDPRPSAEHPAKKHQNSRAIATTPLPHRHISSLVTPFLSIERKAHGLKKLSPSNPKRQSSSASSIRSVTSSVLSRKRKYAAPPTLETLPSEIHDQIFSHLDQETLHSLVLTSKKLREEASYTLYQKPRFASTYRFAQFVTVVTHSRHLAEMVRVLDLSNLGKDVVDEKPAAGWREWKFRSDPLHTIHRDDLSNEMRGPKGIPKMGKADLKKPKSTHPLPSPFLLRYSLIQDIPIGAIIHIAIACKLLKVVKLSNIVLAADYAILPLGSHRTSYYPTAFTGLLFVSDVPKSFTWAEDDTRALKSSTDLINALVGLRWLTELKIRGGLWVTRDAAQKIVTKCDRLEKVDFRECGMHNRSKWTVKGKKEEVLELIREEDEIKRAEFEKKQRLARLAVH